MEAQLRRSSAKKQEEIYEIKEWIRKFEDKHSDDELSDYELTEKDMYPSEARKKPKK